MRGIHNLSPRKVVKAFERAGWTIWGQKGSHVMLVKETKSAKIGCVVPLHDEIERGTLLGILKQAKISRDEFLKDIKK